MIGAATRTVRFTMRHRGWMYLALSLVILVGLGVGAITGAGPAFATTPSTLHAGALHALSATSTDYTNNAAPPSWWAGQIPGIDNLSVAQRYLTFSRWSNVNSLPSPNVGFSNISAALGAGVLLFGRFFLLVASFITYVVGFLLIQAVQLNVLGRASLTIDYLFSSIGRAILYPGAAAGAGVLVLLFVLLIGYSVLRSAGSGNHLRSFLRTFGTGFLALAALVILVLQSTKNHGPNGTTQAAKIESQLGGVKNSVQALNGSATAGTTAASTLADPNSWATGSPGWLIAMGGKVANVVGGAFTGALNGFNGAVQSAGGVSSDPNAECVRYEHALNADFASTKVAKNLGGESTMLVSYDRLVQELYFQPYVLAAFGGSQGAQASWCRIAEQESGSPAGEQALVSQQAGLYAQVVGSPNGASGSVVTSAGNWVNPTKSPADAQSFFGPYFKSADAQNKSLYFFAYCRFPTPYGGPVPNPEWQDVKQAVNGGTQGTALNVGDCTNSMGTSTVAGNTAKIGFDGDYGSGYGDAFGYHESASSNVFGLFGLGNSSSAASFLPAIQKGYGEQAYNMYLTTQGMESSTSLIFSVLTLLIILFMAKHELPLILGGVVAEFIGVVALSLSVFVLLALMVPIPRTRRIGKMTGLTILSAFAASVLFATLIQITLVVVSLFETLFYDPTAAAFLRILQLGAGAILAFMVINMIMKRVFAMDISTFKGAVASSGTLSAKAFLNAGGYATPPLLNKWQNDPQSPAKPTFARSLGGMIKDRTLDGFEDLIRRGAGPKPGSGAAAATGAAAQTPNSPCSCNHPLSAHVAAAKGGRAPRGGSAPLQCTVNGCPCGSFSSAGSAATPTVPGTGGGGAGTATGYHGTAPLDPSLNPKAVSPGASIHARGLEGAAAAAAAVGEVLHPGRTSSTLPTGSASKGALPVSPGVTPSGNPMVLDASATRDSNTGRLVYMVQEMRPAFDRVKAPSLYGKDDGLVATPSTEVGKLPMKEARTLAATGGGLLSSKGPSPLVSGSSTESAGIIRGALNQHASLARSAASTPQFEGEDDVTRVSTMANMFAGARPVTSKELATMAPTDRRAYLQGKLGEVESMELGTDRWYSLPRPAPNTVLDPGTGLYVPSALVRSGSTPGSASPLQGVNMDALTGRWTPTPVSDTRALAPVVLDAATPPAGADPSMWESWRDLRTWMGSNQIDPVLTDVSEWPMDRQLQFNEVYEAAPQLYAALGHSLPEVSEGELEGAAIGLLQSRQGRAPWYGDSLVGAPELTPTPSRPSALPSTELARVESQLMSADPRLEQLLEDIVNDAVRAPALAYAPVEVGTIDRLPAAVESGEITLERLRAHAQEIVAETTNAYVLDRWQRVTQTLDELHTRALERTGRESLPVESIPVQMESSFQMEQLLSGLDAEGLGYEYGELAGAAEVLEMTSQRFHQQQLARNEAPSLLSGLLSEYATGTSSPVPVRGSNGSGGSVIQGIIDSLKSGTMELSELMEVASAEGRRLPIPESAEEADSPTFREYVMEQERVREQWREVHAHSEGLLQLAQDRAALEGARQDIVLRTVQDHFETLGERWQREYQDPYEFAQAVQSGEVDYREVWPSTLESVSEVRGQDEALDALWERMERLNTSVRETTRAASAHLHQGSAPTEVIVGAPQSRPLPVQGTASIRSIPTIPSIDASVKSWFPSLRRSKQNAE